MIPFQEDGERPTELLTEPHADEIAKRAFVLRPHLDPGNVPGCVMPEGMTAHLKGRQIRIFDSAQLAHRCSNVLREYTESIAADAVWRLCSFRKSIPAKKIG